MSEINFNNGSKINILKSENATRGKGWGVYAMTDKERFDKIKEYLFNAVDIALSDNEILSSYDMEYDDLLFLIRLAEKSIRLESENEWLYGKLNMIGDIIEKGRSESKKFQ